MTESGAEVFRNDVRRVTANETVIRLDVNRGSAYRIIPDALKLHDVKEPIGAGGNALTSDEKAQQVARVEHQKNMSFL